MRRGPLVTAVRKTLEALGTPRAGEALVVGLSGGADSVALLDALARLRPRLGFSLLAAHLDHGLRAGSAADAAFCVGLCRRLEVPLRTGRADVAARAARERGGLEQAARRARYGFLRRVRRELGATAIAVAHTRDDQAETLLMRLLRGSGRRGLSGMRRRQRDVIRPLLGVSRAQVVSHLRSQGLEWREDPSNLDMARVRNRVRHELLPYLEARFNPRLRETLARSADMLADEAALMERLGAELYERLRRPRDLRLESAGSGPALERAALAGADPALARAALRRWLWSQGGLRRVSARHIDQILSAARSQASRPLHVELPAGRTPRIVDIDHASIAMPGATRRATGPREPAGARG